MSVQDIADTLECIAKGAILLMIVMAIYIGSGASLFTYLFGGRKR